MPTFNPPPNWPPPPPGWTPPPGWQPNPRWGPAPDGWRLWIDDAGDGKRANHDAFVRVGIVAAVVYVTLIVLIVSVAHGSSYEIGYALGRIVFPWLVASLIAFFSKKRWSWPAIVVVFIGLVAVFTMISNAGRMSGG